MSSPGSSSRTKRGRRGRPFLEILTLGAASCRPVGARQHPAGRPSWAFPRDMEGAAAGIVDFAHRRVHRRLDQDVFFRDPPRLGVAIARRSIGLRIIDEVLSTADAVFGRKTSIGSSSDEGRQGHRLVTTIWPGYGGLQRAISSTRPRDPGRPARRRRASTRRSEQAESIARPSSPRMAAVEGTSRRRPPDRHAPRGRSGNSGRGGDAHAPDRFLVVASWFGMTTRAPDGRSQTGPKRSRRGERPGPRLIHSTAPG